MNLRLGLPDATTIQLNMFYVTRNLALQRCIHLEFLFFSQASSQEALQPTERLTSNLTFTYTAVKTGKITYVKLVVFSNR